MQQVLAATQLRFYNGTDGNVKKCPKCGFTKKLDQLSSRSTVAHIPCSYCSPCQRDYCRRHYASHRTSHNARRYLLRTAERDEITQRIWSYKMAKSCVDCGEADPLVLEFDHVRGLKKANIGTMLRTSTWIKIQDEIRKCELRCANCHRRKTAAQRKWKVRAFAENLSNNGR